jgi:hypothetical protein
MQTQRKAHRGHGEECLAMSGTSQEHPAGAKPRHQGGDGHGEQRNPTSQSRASRNHECGGCTGGADEHREGDELFRSQHAVV